MNCMRRIFALTLWSLLTASLALACHTIAGIEDRTYEPTATTQASAECRTYCDTVMRNCTGEFQVYNHESTCLGVCEKLELGSALEPVGNTVACRTSQAAFAASTGEPNVHCPRAGPGGANTCGDNCESYCTLNAKVCTPEFPDIAQCIAKCAALKDTGAFDAIVNHDGDNLQCRLVHVSSATVNPVEHCPHARLGPTSPCTDPDESAPECTDFCRVAMTACTGELAAYESNEQCLAVCAALPRGKIADRTENTVGCRKYHSYSAIFDPVSHCPHTGPTGDGHCGDNGKPESGFTGNCESYCLLLERACSTEFAGAFADQATCHSQCLTLNGAGLDAHYAVVRAQSGNTVECRALHASRALTDPTACGAALGGAPCQ